MHRVNTATNRRRWKWGQCPSDTAGYTTKVLIVNYQGSLVQVEMMQVEISSEAA